MIYYVDGEIFATAKLAFDYIEEHCDLYDEFDEFLDENGEIEIFGLHYSASYVWHEVDPTAYECAYNDYASNQLEDVEFTLENMEDGDVEYVLGFEVEAEEENDDAYDSINSGIDIEEWLKENRKQ